MRHAAVQRVDMAFERGADAERHDRRVVPGADLHRVDHVLARFGEDHGVGRRIGDPGQRVAVLLAHGLGGDDAIAESGGEIGVERGDRVARVGHRACGRRKGEGHGVALSGAGVGRRGD